jgi:hypothetical protein
MQNPIAIAAKRQCHSAGSVGAVFQCVRIAWQKMYGGCPVTALRGNVLTAAVRTGSEISEPEHRKEKQCQKY